MGRTFSVVSLRFVGLWGLDWPLPGRCCLTTLLDYAAALASTSSSLRPSPSFGRMVRRFFLLPRCFCNTAKLGCSPSSLWGRSHCTLGGGRWLIRGSTFCFVPALGGPSKIDTHCSSLVFLCGGSGLGEPKRRTPRLGLHVSGPTTLLGLREEIVFRLEWALLLGPAGRDRECFQRPLTSIPGFDGPSYCCRGLVDKSGVCVSVFFWRW